MLCRQVTVFLLMALTFVTACNQHPSEKTKAKALNTGDKGKESVLIPPERRTISLKDYIPGNTSLRRISETGEFSVRLLEGEVIADGAGEFQRQWVTLDGHCRAAIIGLTPFVFRTRVRIPARGELWLALNQHGAGLDDSGVSYRIHVRDQTRDTVVLNDRLCSFGLAWKERKIDLERWSGQEVDLIFESMLDPPVATSAPTKPVTTCWGDLALRSRVANTNRPNIVVILLDTLRPDHMETHGYGRPTSPNIDAVAKNGVVFENAISTSPWTDPSILSLMTGLYPSDVWEPSPHEKAIKKPLPDGVSTLAELLQREGYFTIAASDHPGVNVRRFGQGFDVYAALLHVNVWIGWHETGARKVLTQLEQLIKGRGGSGLFFYLHLIYPHAPYNPPPEYKKLSGSGEYRVEQSNRNGLLNLYDSEIMLTDAVVGAFQRLLADNQLTDDLILFILSDHGEGFWEHGLFEHGNSLYNELLRFTLIVHAPGRLPAGVRVDDVVSMVDVLPTILELTGIEAPQDIRGQSLLPLISEDAGSERLAYSEFPHKEDYYLAYAIQSGSYKIIFGQNEPKELMRFDLDNDPLELQPLKGLDLSQEGSLLDELNRIRSSATEHRQSLKSTIEEPSKETIERLRSLGYIK